MAQDITRRQAVKAIGAAAAVIAAGGVDALASGTGTTPSTGTGTATPSSTATPSGKKSARNMKVLLINGSPRSRGNTNRLLEEVAAQLGRSGIDSEIVQIGTRPVRGCIACGKCTEGRCVFADDICNSVIDKMASADALVVGSPVYYGIPAGQVLSLIQRMAYAGGSVLRGKPAAAVTVCRRGGGTSAFQTLQMPFQMLSMPIVTSQYWNIGYGAAPGEVADDAEGLQTMRTLADNLAYMLKQFATGEAAVPERERGVHTNFIR